MARSDKSICTRGNPTTIRGQSVFSFLILGLSYGFAADAVNNPSSAERFAKPSSELVTRENEYWQRTPLNVPADIVLEVSGIVANPGKRLLVTTRRGEVWQVEGAYEADAKPTFTL